MKFSCDRCGKKYATADAPAPGRVYKLKCKACGHLIVVKTPAAGAPAEPPPRAQTTTSMVSIQAIQPEVEVPIDVPAAAPPPESPIPAHTPIPSRSHEPTAEISMIRSVVEPSAPPPPPPPPAPPAGGYVDLFADAAPAAPAAPAETPAALKDDPFAAARGAGGMDDPFADMRDELEGAPSAKPAAPALTPTPGPATDAAPPPAFAPPPRPPEDKKKGGLPVALIGLGFVAIVGIVVAVAVKSGKKVEPPKPPPPAVAVAPVPPPPPPEPAKPEPEPPKKAEPARAAPKPEPKPEPKKEPRKEEPKAAKAEPPRPPPPKPPPPPAPKKEEPKVARAEPAKPVQLPDATSALSPEQVQKVVNASRRAFEECISSASKKGGDIKFDGRKVSLRLNVNPNGFVTYPTLDDVTLNRTDLGECLKAAARLMVFPKFQGDVFHVEVPLTLRGG